MRTFARCGGCARVGKEGWIRIIRDEDGRLIGWYHVAREDVYGFA